MNIFRKNFVNISDEKKKKEIEEKELQKLREANLGMKDIAAIFIAMIQLILPIALGLVVIYFIVLQFLTKVWFKY